MAVLEIGTDEVEVVLDIRAELGEGPLWDAREQVLWWVDILAGHVHRFDPATGQDRVFEAGQYVGAVALRADRPGLVLAAHEGFIVLEPDGQVKPFVTVELELPGNRMNDGYCDERGRFWAGTMAISEGAGAGSLYRLDPGGEVTKMLGGVSISNGIDWSGDGRTMYYIDTPTHLVEAFDCDMDAGIIGNRRTFATIPDGMGGPDGMIVDADDCLWVGLFGGSQLRRYTPDGEVERIVHLPAANVTKCAFGGPALEDLFITTAWHNATPEQREREPHAGSLFRCRPGVRGREAHRYRG
ncbi:MAG TPA: SMP-30/gluconolactonase/LRE family protein [Candidatus Dormibacteraeota bacterium]|jgi:sugar lactone lactonase YvrE|nr:SMP-30/gluconolactonase/LRE family protein [Candidatus Dormibacteraeota bacterium]